MTGHSVPTVLFVCVHNAGRSQMATALMTHFAGDRIKVRSAGTEPAEQVNPAAVAALAEIGIDIAAATPKVLTSEAVQSSDVVITMGCGDTCPYFPGLSYRDWKLDDPAGQPLDVVRGIRDDITGRVRALVDELLSKPMPASSAAAATSASGPTTTNDIAPPSG
jgi:arsenate reductase (thioredoxin)